MRLLLISNSRAPDGSWLEWPREHIRAFLGDRSANVVFVPHAALPATKAAYSAYATKAAGAFGKMGYGLSSIHEAAEPLKGIASAECIVIGGGNTFQLLDCLLRHEFAETIIERVRAGVPFIGWSAGANMACPGIWTTNDMPIVEPPSLRALGLVPFQINPHFTDAQPASHQGETRSQRIAEFLALNSAATVVGLPEGSALRVEGVRAKLVSGGAVLFRANTVPSVLNEGDEVPFDA